MTAPNAQYGINVRGDATRVVALRDGTDLDAVWDIFRDLLDVWNKERSSITDLLTFKTTLSAEAVPQTVAIGSFETRQNTVCHEAPMCQEPRF
jgi:hypothetical protein